MKQNKIYIDFEKIEKTGKLDYNNISTIVLVSTVYDSNYSLIRSKSNKIVISDISDEDNERTIIKIETGISSMNYIIWGKIERDENNFWTFTNSIDMLPKVYGKGNKEIKQEFPLILKYIKKKYFNDKYFKMTYNFNLNNEFLKDDDLLKFIIRFDKFDFGIFYFF
jgi:hypothetical protein